MRQVGLRIALVLGSLLLSLLVAEGVLRLSGFHYEIAPDRVEFGAPNPKIMKRHRSDPDLFWVDREYPARLAKLRHHRPEIVFQGDSVTALGDYPQRLVERLEEDAEREIVGVSLAVTGWSSFQGLRQLELHVVPQRPSVVTILFGWNDHWIGFGVEDEEIHDLVSVLSPFRQLRLSHLVFRAWLGARSRDRDEWPLRVPPDRFRANLSRMVAIAREHGIVPVLITAPSAHEVGREPRHLAARWIRDLRELVPLHQSYVEIVREVAASEGAPLCDAAAHFDTLSAEARRTRYFMGDGFHLLPEGHERMAAFLLECFESERELASVLERWRRGGDGAHP